MPYDYGVDMWSIGCTLYELYTGKILFTGDSNNQMLKAIMEIRGKLTPKLYRRGQLSGVHFDEAGHFVSVERDKVLNKLRLNMFFSHMSCARSTSLVTWRPSGRSWSREWVYSRRALHRFAISLCRAPTLRMTCRRPPVPFDPLLH